MKVVKDGNQVVVVCRSGDRSRSATTALILMRYDAPNQPRGGMNAWTSAGVQVVDRLRRTGSI